MAKRTPILCTDGTIISVQASSTHGCSPKSDEAFAYGAVEILIDKPNDPEGYNKVDKIESWCSAARLMRLIEMHGGIIGGQLPPLDFFSILFSLLVVGICFSVVFSLLRVLVILKAVRNCTQLNGLLVSNPLLSIAFSINCSCLFILNILIVTTSHGTPLVQL